MRGPAGMPHAAVARQRLTAVGHIIQRAQAAARLDNLNFPAALAHSQAGRVIPAIFQMRQPCQQDGRGGTAAGVSNDSAHVDFSYLKACGVICRHALVCVRMGRFMPNEKGGSISSRPEKRWRYFR